MLVVIVLKIWLHILLGSFVGSAAWLMHGASDNSPLHDKRSAMTEQKTEGKKTKKQNNEEV